MPVTPFDPAGGTGSSSPVALPKQVLVGAKSDLPAPSGGVITLAADTEYLFTDDVSVGTDRIVLSSGTLVSAQDSSIAALTYTGTGNMFTAIGVSNKITRITINCPNGAVFDIDGSSTGIFQLFDMTVGICKTIGTWKDLFGSQITNVAFGSITTGGLLFTGAHGIFLSSGNLFGIAAGTLFDLGTATFNSLSITSSFPDVAAGATFLSGAADSANINTGGFATVQDVIQSGLGAALSGITTDDDQWQFSINSDVSDTAPDGLLSFNTPTTTTIATVDTPVLINGTWTSEAFSQFTLTAAGRATYTGVKDVRLPVSIGTTIEAASGTNKDITLYLALNGTVIANSKTVNQVGSNDQKNTSIMWQLDLVMGDFLEVFIENNTDAVDLVVNKASFRIA